MQPDLTAPDCDPWDRVAYECLLACPTTDAYAEALGILDSWRRNHNPFVPEVTSDGERGIVLALHHSYSFRVYADGHVADSFGAVQ